MNLVNKTVKNIKNVNNYEIIFVALVVLYLISNVSTPYALGSTINNVFTYLSMIVITGLMLLNKKYLLAVSFAVFCSVLLYRSKKVDPIVNKPSEENKDKKMKTFNKHLDKKSLEEEVIESIVKKPDNIPSPSTYHPVLCSSHNADEV